MDKTEPDWIWEDPQVQKPRAAPSKSKSSLDKNLASVEAHEEQKKEEAKPEGKSVKDGKVKREGKSVKDGKVEREGKIEVNENEETLDGHRLIKVLNEDGGFGTTYLGHDTNKD
jgi:hypothetical protein